MSNNNTQGKTARNALLIIVGIIAGIIYLWHAGAVDNAKHIEAVLAQHKQVRDLLINRVNTQKTESEEDLDRIAGYFDDYVEKAREIDTHECPREFADAYSRYVSAMADEGAAWHGHPHIPSDEEAFISGFIKGLQGDPMGEVRTISESMDSWGKTLRERNERVKQAEQQIIEVGARYELYSWPR